MKYILTFVAGVVVSAAVMFFVGSFHTSLAPSPERVGKGSTDHYFPEVFYNGLTANTYATKTVGSSSSSPAALVSAAAGHFIIAAGSTTANASTTAITANSTVSMTLEKDTPIAGTTCNTSVNASSTPMQVTKIAGNGFIVTIPSAPVTNPFCVAYRITN